MERSRVQYTLLQQVVSRNAIFGLWKPPGASWDASGSISGRFWSLFGTPKSAVFFRVSTGRAVLVQTELRKGS